MELPRNWETKILALFNEHTMLYEPRMETAKNYNELRERLKARGFKNLPSGAIPLLQFGNYGTVPTANISSVDVVKTMLRKKK
jgi:hypothetical protein